jgi:hypothetical protein
VRRRDAGAVELERVWIDQARAAIEDAYAGLL